MIDLALVHKLKPAHRLTPKTLLGNNLLFVPLAELTEECANILGDNPFFHFNPPHWQNSYIDIDTLDEDLLPAKKNLEEHLSLQIATCPEICGLRGRASSPDYWCSVLDSRGYLNTQVEEIAGELALTEERAAACIRGLQAYVEPPGLFASGLKECLLIQLERRGLMNSAPWLLLTEGFDYLISGKSNDFAAKKGWKEDILIKSIDILRNLDPSPGKNFTISGIVLPEIEFLTQRPIPVPRLLRANLPSIGNSLSEMPLSAREILSQKWMSSVWSRTKFVLFRLGMRYRTLIRISICIAEKQSEYINGEKKTLDPLTYESAAEMLGLNTSTVFRSINNTWCVVSGKVLPMKTFFSRGLCARPDISVNELRLRIATLNKEGCNDRMIAEIMSVPTRTIAHHRKKMALAPARRTKK